MPQYRYMARDRSGQGVRGLMQAPDERALGQVLSEQGLILVEARLQKGQKAASAGRGRVPLRELILFTNHLSVAVGAGVPVVSAIGDYARDSSHPAMRLVAADVERQVLAGSGLSGAMSTHPKVFSELYTSVVATGEATGQMDTVLQDLVGFMEWQEELRGQIRQASIYPSFMVAMIIGVVVIMMTFTLPKFIPVLKGFGVPLPMPTRVLIATSDFFTTYWYVLLLGLGALVGGLSLLNRHPAGRLFLDRIRLALPLVGGLSRKILLSQFAHYFAMMYRSGIGILQSFNIISGVVVNRVFRRSLIRIREGVEQGRSLYEALSSESLYPPLVQRMVQVGEQTGQLDMALEKVSSYYDREVPASIRKVFAAFEPLLILFMGGVVLFIALSVFLPIYQLSNAIGGAAR